MPAILPRAQDGSYTITNPVYIAGVCLIGIVALGVGIWLVRRYYQKRRAAKMDLGFLSVKGLFPEHPTSEETATECVPYFFRKMFNFVDVFISGKKRLLKGAASQGTTWIQRFLCPKRPSRDLLERLDKRSLNTTVDQGSCPGPSHLNRFLSLSLPRLLVRQTRGQALKYACRWLVSQAAHRVGTPSSPPCPLHPRFNRPTGLRGKSNNCLSLFCQTNSSLRRLGNSLGLYSHSTTAGVWSGGKMVWSCRQPNHCSSHHLYPKMM